jgi:hypothetical protein
MRGALQCMPALSHFTHVPNAHRFCMADFPAG